MRLRIGFLTLVASASISVSALCPGPVFAQAPETPKIRVSTLPIAGQVPIYTAQKLGYFKDAGLEVDITFADVQPGIHIASYAGDGAWIKANPKTVKAFTDAMARAIDYLEKNPDQAKTLIAEFTKAKPELVQQVPIDDWSTKISVDDLAKQLELMRQEGVLKKPIEAGSLL